MSEIRRVSGTEYPNMVCKFCAHGKVWHRNDGPCSLDDLDDEWNGCDCQAWDYGVNVDPVEVGDTQKEDG